MALDRTISMANSDRYCVRLHGQGISHAITALFLAKVAPSC